MKRVIALVKGVLTTLLCFVLLNCVLLALLVETVDLQPFRYVGF